MRVQWITARQRQCFFSLLDKAASPLSHGNEGLILMKAAQSEETDLTTRRQATPIYDEDVRLRAVHGHGHPKMGEAEVHPHDPLVSL